MYGCSVRVPPQPATLPRMKLAAVAGGSHCTTLFREADQGWPCERNEDGACVNGHRPCWAQRVTPRESGWLRRVGITDETLATMRHLALRSPERWRHPAHAGDGARPPAPDPGILYPQERATQTRLAQMLVRRQPTTRDQSRPRSAPKRMV